MDCRVHPCASPSHTPISAHLQQPETSPCPSPYVCLSNNHVAGTGIGLPSLLCSISGMLLLVLLVIPLLLPNCLPTTSLLRALPLL